MTDKKRRVLIMGAAGRDFHNFNTVFRDDPSYEVVAFTATQIPDIAGRRYPPELAGELYPEGVPIHDESELVSLIHEHDIDEVVFAYSDVPHTYVMSKGALVNATGADFRMIGAKPTMVESSVPIIAVCAARTGAGKSQTTRRVCEILKERGKKVVVIRHPMPYGDLVAQKVQRFASYDDLEKHDCTIEEREEYEPHIVRGTVVYAGVDYEAILREAEKEADVIVWDGGNNDLPFYRPNLHITVVDPLRPGHEVSYYPGETNVRMSDAVVINKIVTARPEDIETVRDNVGRVNPDATVIIAASPITVDDPSVITRKDVLVVEDGPTLTHGGMTYGAGVVAARQYGARPVDPKQYAVGSIAETFEKYPHISGLLPAMGYGDDQIRDLEKTISAVPADAVVIATPIDLRRLVKIKTPAVRVRYELQEIGSPTLTDLLGGID
jgi:predicted GTPase